LFVLLLALESARPAAAWYFSGKSAAALKAGWHDEAMRLIDRSVFLEGGNASYHNQKASVLYAEYKKDGDTSLLQGALTELDVARLLNPNDAVWHHGLGLNILCSRKGQGRRRPRFNPP
jgi:hypothetical protein